MDPRGKTAIITGAAGGIGRATARALAREGARIVVADIDGAGAEAVAAEIVASDGEAIGLRFDVVADPFETLRDRALDRFGRIDIVMNNVGVITNGLPEAIPLDEWRRVFEINLLSVVRSNQVFVPLLAGQGSGHIVNTGSIAGLFTYAYDRTPYAACKAALVQLSEALAIYLKPQGVQVTLLCPGPVITGIANAAPSFGERVPIRTPGPGFGLLQPEAVGEMMVEAIRAPRFLLPTHEAVWDKLAARAADWDGFIQGQIDNLSIVHLG